MKNATYVDQSDTIRSLTDGRSRSPQRGVQTMRKLSLVLAALFSFAVSAEANPYKVKDADGKAFGPVIGPGTMIVLAPDGTPVVVNESPAGFVNSLPPNSSLPFIYLDPSCDTQAYLIASSVPPQGLALLDDPNEIFYPSATIFYANAPYGLLRSTPTYAIVYNNSSSSFACQPAPLPPSAPIGPVASFRISHRVPFHAEQWSPQ